MNTSEFVKLLLASGLAMLLTFGIARADSRVALVIANSNYANAPVLANPASDANSIAGALRGVGFGVDARHDLSKTALEAALHDFAAKASTADVALVYYAGHGVEIGGENYLIPVDAKLSNQRDVDFEAVSLDLVMHAVENARRLKLIVLDACRNNPFAAQLSNGTRAIERGLARVEPQGDMLVAYAAKAGTTAEDGTTNSPFAAAFARDLRTPGLDIRLMLGKVRDDVMAETNNQQEPFVYGSLGGAPYYFNPASAGLAEKPASPPPAGSDAVELAMWQSVLATNDPVEYQAYLNKYPDGTFAELARNRLVKLSAPPDPCTSVVSVWTWYSISPVTLRSDGTATNGWGVGGHWTCSKGHVEISWPGLFSPAIDSLTLSEDGQHLRGQNQEGTAVWGDKQ